METLDEYLLANIYKYLSYADIYNVSLVSKHLSKGFNVYQLWEYKYNELDDDHRIDDDNNSIVAMRTISKLCKIKKCFYLCTGIKQLYNYVTLNMINTELTYIPKEISCLTNLKNLYLNANQLTSIPKEIGYLTGLNRLDLDYNQLASIPKEISCLTNLKTLHLHNNKLTSIPKEIGCLTSLNYLYLHNNLLTHIPEKIKNLNCYVKY